jgi:glycosyltransferase involved in cell wall biosynthesis
MRLLHVVAPASVGGLERVVQTLAIAQQDRGDDVQVAALFAGSPGADADHFSAPLRAAGVRVVVLTLAARAYVRERAAVAQLGRDAKAQIVHTHGYRPDVVDGRAARDIGAGAVTTVHGFTGGGLRNRFYEWLQVRAFRGFDAVVAVSQPLVERLTGAGVVASRLHLIVNTWRPFGSPLGRREAREQLGVPADAFVIGWVGRVSSEKGLDVLVRALPHLGGIHAHVAVLGEGAERTSVEALLRASGEQGRLSWCGVVPDAARVFAAFDVLVLSSRTEGTPMVLFEAMWAAVPIVATRVGGIPHMLSAAEATLVPPGDPQKLAQAIRDVAEQRSAAEVRALAARQRLERESDVRSWAGAYSVVYDAALDEAGRK